MKSIASGRNRVGNYFAVGILSLLMPVFLMACGGGPKHMINQDTKPPIAAKSGKAVFVVVRTTRLWPGHRQLY